MPKSRTLESFHLGGPHHDANAPFRAEHYCRCRYRDSPDLHHGPLRAGRRSRCRTAAPTVDADLKKDVENFWHYGKVGKYDLSADAANKIIGSGKDAVEVLKAFEVVAEDSKDKLDVWMLRWQNVEKLREPTAKLLTTLDEGRKTRRADAAWIDSNIKALSENQRSYYLAIERIRDSGELAVRRWSNTSRTTRSRRITAPSARH